MKPIKIEQFNKEQLENFHKEQDRLAQRIDYHGPKWNWPINKLANEKLKEKS